MRIRLERLRIEGNEAPMHFGDFEMYYDMFRDNPSKVEAIIVEECGADRFGRLYVIKDGRHRYVAAILTGMKDILAQYKEPGWIRSTGRSTSTLPAALPAARSSSSL